MDVDLDVWSRSHSPRLSALAFSSHIWNLAKLSAAIASGAILPDEQLEDALGDDEFARVFKMTRDAFAALPEFKRNNLKSKHGLYFS